MCGIPAAPGLNTNVLSILKTKVKTMTDLTRHCMVTFDEMSLRKELKYSRADDVVNGLVQLPTREAVACNQALVFMVRGLAANWKQPLSFYFSENAASAKHLKNLLFEILEALRSISLKPIVVVCDQGSCNRSLYQSLGINEERPFFMVCIKSSIIIINPNF